MTLRNKLARFVFLFGCFCCGIGFGAGVVMVTLGYEFPTLMLVILVALTAIQYQINKAVENADEN